MERLLGSITRMVIKFNDFMIYLAKWKRTAVLLLIIWTGVIYLMILNILELKTLIQCKSSLSRFTHYKNGFISSKIHFSSNESSDEVLELQDSLRRVSSQLASLKQKHSNLIAQIKKSSGLDGNSRDLDPILLRGDGPTEEYEYLRRRIQSNTKDLWYYVSHELSKVLKEDNKVEAIQGILDEVAKTKGLLLSDQEKLPELDEHHEWRQAEAANVSDLIQRRLYYLQNPPDCREARKVICNLTERCGFGCQLHHMIYCLIFAYATERTAILNSKYWGYNNHGWEHVLHPISDTCTTAYNPYRILWYDTKVITLSLPSRPSRKPKFLPLAVPEDLAHRIVRFHGDPSSWWIGQMLKFILKPRAWLQKAINETIAKMNFKKPIVGVHIRRTDKGDEAKFYHIDEYMRHVRDYYDTLALARPVDVRRVYLATDDANVSDDARKKYPDYVFLGDSSIVETAAVHRRFTPLGLIGLLVDLHMLAMCDYIVCTFSSNVGRAAYEMMQTNRVDASNSFFSLDGSYFFWGQNEHHRIAVMKNRGGNHVMSLKVNDLIGQVENFWNGSGNGTNKRTNLNGLFPWYKTADHLVLYPFPEYKQVPLYT